MKRQSLLKTTGLWSFLLAGVMIGASCSTGQKLFQEGSGGWESFGEANWNTEQNELVGTVSGGKTGFVMTKETFDDFILELEFRPDSTINSGVFIRCGKKDINTNDCYELNIWDTNPNQNFRTGALVTKTNALAKVETHNKWNTYKIQAQDGHIQVWVNDILTTDTQDDSLKEGFVGLQALGNGTIRFRNITIKQL